MRAVKRPRRYVARHWLVLLRPLLRHSSARNAYVLRLVGSNYGPVLRAERRTVRSHPSDGIERRASTA
jgi:hypothetical protein